MRNKFKAPEDWQSYSNSIIEKTRLLIRLQIWDEVEELNLDSWLKNFTDKEGIYFAACILDAFIYRSKKMCHSMLRNILNDLVPNYCREIKIANFDSLKQWKELFLQADNLVRFVPANISDGKVKSSTIVAREFLHANDIHSYIVQQPENIQRVIDNGTKLIVFIDDIAGSGRQFKTFCKQIDIEQYKGKVHFLYAPLVAHPDAITAIEKEYNFLKVRPIDTLNESHNFFHACENGFFRGDGTNTVEGAKKFYDSIFPSDSKSTRKYMYGMNSHCLTYSFHFSTPNNNIKALYHNGPSWNRLIFRVK